MTKTVPWKGFYDVHFSPVTFKTLGLGLGIVVGDTRISTSIRYQLLFHRYHYFDTIFDIDTLLENIV